MRSSLVRLTPSQTSHATIGGHHRPIEKVHRLRPVVALQPPQAHQRQHFDDDDGHVGPGPVTAWSLRTWRLRQYRTGAGSHCFDASHAFRNARSAAVSCRPVLSTGTSCRRGSSPTVSVSSCAMPRRRIDNRTLSPGRRRWTASSRRLGPLPRRRRTTAARRRDRGRPCTRGVSSMVGMAIRGVPLLKSNDSSPIQERPGLRLRRIMPARARSGA